jgi:type II secretory pathway component PulL
MKLIASLDCIVHFAPLLSRFTQDQNTPLASEMLHSHYVYKKRIPYQKQLHEIDRNIELLAPFKDVTVTAKELPDVKLINLDEESDYILFITQTEWTV